MKWLLLFVLLWSSLVSGQFFDDEEEEISMTETKKTVLASQGSDAVLSCSAYMDDAERCKFYRPDGQMVCPDLDEEEEMSNFSSDHRCVEDPNAKIMTPDGTTCSLRLTGVKSSLHHGEWTCRLESSYGAGETKISVSGPQAVAVEFVDVWGRVTVDLSESDSTTFKCKALPDDPSGAPLAEAPGPMTWKLGGRVMQTSNNYKKNRDGEFVQSFTYSPDLYDDGQSLVCSVKDGVTGRTVEDEIELVMVMFKPAEGFDEPISVKQGEPASIPITFEAYPKPVSGEDEDDGTKVYWLLDTPDDPELKLWPGQKQQRFRASELENVGQNKYKASLDIKKVSKWEMEHTHKLVIDGGRDSVEPQVIPVKLDVQAASAPVPPPPPPPAEINVEPIPASSTAMPVATPAGNGTTNGTLVANSEVEQAGTSKVSLYIIIAIIALVVLLCVLFYATKACRKRRAREAALAEEEAARARGDKGTNDAVSPDKQRLLEEERQLEEARKRVEAEMEVNKESAPLMQKTAAPETKTTMKTFGASAVVYEDENKVQKTVQVEQGFYMRMLDPGTPSPSSLKSQDTRSTEVETIAITTPFLHVRPLPANHPSQAEEHLEIDRMTAKIRQDQPNDAQLTSPDLVKAVTRQDQESLPGGEPIIKLEKVRRHGEPEEDVDDIFNPAEPVIRKVYVEHKIAEPITPQESIVEKETVQLHGSANDPRFRSQETEERAKGWRENPLFRTNTAPEPEYRQTPSQASTASAKSNGEGGKWENMDEVDPAEHRGIMNQVDAIIANLHSDYPDHGQQHQPEFQPGGIALTPSQEGKSEHGDITSNASLLRKQEDVDRSSKGEHIGITGAAKELREMQDVDGEASGEHSSIGEKTDTLRRSMRKNKNKEHGEYFAGGFTAAQQTNGSQSPEPPMSPSSTTSGASTSAVSTQTPRLKQKLGMGGALHFASSDDSLNEEEKDKKNKMREAEQSMFM